MKFQFFRKAHDGSILWAWSGDGDIKIIHAELTLSKTLSMNCIV